MDFDPDRVDFDEPAILRKWPSLANQRRTNSAGPYSLVYGSLDECVRELMAKPAPTRHLYEICTERQLPLVSSVLVSEQAIELERFRNFV
jgi:hypothetical protein